jgi:hypothetical protein
VPNFSRVGDYLYGGRNNFEADRKAARALVAIAPVLGKMGPAMRAFHNRAVRYLAAEAGIRQFLDVGTGLAISGNTHDVAQQVDPSCRVAYADSDPMVLAHARALMKSGPVGATGFIDADVRDPDGILEGAARILDLDRPTAILLLPTLARVEDTATAAAIVRVLASGVSSGSHVAIYHMASDLDPAMPAAAAQGRQWPSISITLRSRAEVTTLVAGLDPVPPGVVPICEWRPEPADPRFETVIPLHGVVARKP